ncbi:MAG: hypothetical protein K2G45_07360 [Lachnospiraceae bacterium]|nr:hypothetical protein [Lachnospiraceae bacterium]
MSKKCCGKSYPDDAEICEICGLPIAQDSVSEDEEDILIAMAEQDILEEKEKEEAIFDDEEVEKALEEVKSIPITEVKASKGLKIAGVTFLSLAIVGLVLVGAFIYFMVISPYYDKNDKRFDLNYPELASQTDVDKIREKLEIMATPSDATISDAYAEEQEVE